MNWTPERVASPAPVETRRLSAGGVTLVLPAQLVSMAAPLGLLGPFEAPAAGAGIRVEWHGPRADRPGDAEAMPGVEAGWVAVHGDVLHAWAPRTPEGALAVLRGAWAEACGRQGAVLLHGAGVHQQGRAAVVTGPPDAGKSTCAEQALGAGASLLSDEVLALFPGGTVQGTPFRSSLAVPPSPARVRCAALLTLEKAPTEAIRPAPSAGFAAALLAQVWTPAGLGLSPASARTAALRFADGTFRGTFAFRKHPDAGRFLLEWLDAL